jgi:hypothetical protein
MAAGVRNFHGPTANVTMLDLRSKKTVQRQNFMYIQRKWCADHRPVPHETDRPTATYLNVSSRDRSADDYLPQHSETLPGMAWWPSGGSTDRSPVRCSGLQEQCGRHREQWPLGAVAAWSSGRQTSWRPRAGPKNLLSFLFK